MSVTKLTEKPMLELRVGEWIEVRSWDEISSTLDERGCLDSLPFMPEMLQYCGKKFRVYKSAHKACDTIAQSGNRHMTDAVHLEGLRCDGTAHGGCQARCLLFWKTAWLKLEPGSQPKGFSAETPGKSRNTSNNGRAHCDVYDLSRATRWPAAQRETTRERYRCQATDLFQATTPMRWWDVSQYAKDLTSRNIRLRDFIRYGLIAAFNASMRLPSRLNERAMRVLSFVTNQEQQQSLSQTSHQHSATIPGNLFLTTSALAHGFVRHVAIATLKLLEPLSSRLHPYPYVRGLAKGKTPTAVLNLEPGELVQVRSKDEIMRTINSAQKNHGLKIEVEMTRYCGGVYRVLARVERIINEKNGKMIHLFNDCLILEDVTCTGCLTRNRLFCPRSIYPFWREIWLKRVDNGKAERSEAQCESISSLK